MHSTQIPFRHVYVAIGFNAEKLVRHGYIVQLGSVAVQEVCWWLPYVIHKTVAKGELCYVAHVVLKPIISPTLTEINLH